MSQVSDSKNPDNNSPKNSNADSLPQGTIALAELDCEDEAVIIDIHRQGPLRRRLFEFGVLPGTKIRRIKCAPLGDPVKYQLRGYCISLRREDAKYILVRLLPKLPLLPLSMLSRNEIGEIVSIETDTPDTEELESYGIKVGVTVKVLRSQRNLLTIEVNHEQIALTKAVSSKIHVVKNGV